MGTERIILTDRQEAWLVRHFKHTKNDEITLRLGISHSTLHRFARKLGLRKTPQFMRKCLLGTAAKARESHIRNGTYPPKGYIVPRSREFRFKKGETPLMRLGPKREAERIARAAASRERTRRSERARAAFGLPQRTRLRVVRHPVKMIQQRWYLKKRGYVIDEREKLAYWTDATRRAVRLEERAVREGRGKGLYYGFAPLP